MSDADSKLKKLAQLGQSPWYDNIDRRLIDNGALKALFDKGILGVTSNPTIFEKAVNSSSVYDAKIRRYKEEGLGVEAIYDALTADDVRDAADMLLTVYERSRGVDGYVSIEVLPSYAHDPIKTVAYAKHIFKKVGRRNIMIKVPGTKESPAAITSLIADGINVNVTLLFSVAQYECVAFAYMEGLRKRAAEGLDLASAASVASVFISRIDTKIDALLDALASRTHDMGAKEGLYALKGKIAISNAKMIYQRFKEISDDRMFGDLASRGGRLQRPLWASTGTKNPLYSDVIYVDNLIGPQTVNTMPPQTVEAFADHGKLSLTVESGLQEARAHLARLEELGIGLERICEDAQTEGVAAFEQSFKALMGSLQAKTAGL